MTDPFFVLHQGLDREGPGSDADVRWVADCVELPSTARICDAACGPGADTLSFLQIAPKARLTAVDAHGPFIDELHGRIGPDPRVTAYRGDMAKLKGPFDLIWCAGAVYFLGIEKALTAWRPCLARGGAVAFSEPCLFSDTPSEAARAYWEGYPASSEARIRDRVAASGFEVVATRPVSDAGWAAYHRALAARVAELRPRADSALSAVLDAAEAEIADWQHVKTETGYLLLVVRPV